MNQQPGVQAVPASGKGKSGPIDAKVAGSGKRKSGEDAAARDFIRRFYKDVLPRAIQDESPRKLHAAAFSFWKFAAMRLPGRAKIRVYNPEAGEHGWQGDHTVVEMINDDMPFLVDSVVAALNGQDLAVHRLLHPIIRRRRNRRGRAIEMAPGDAGTISESYLHIEVTAQSGERLREIAAAVEHVAAQVRLAVDDWQPMRRRLKEIVKGLSRRPARVSVEETVEARDFLRWLHDDNFTFLGYRNHDFKTAGKETRVTVSPRTTLGILRDPRLQVFRELRAKAPIPPEMQAFARQRAILMVAKSDERSAVHRPVHLDAIGIKRFDGKGKVIGLHLFVGLFTSAAYNRNPRSIPLLRRKVKTAVERADFPPASHNAKTLLNILETFPRDELFQVSDDHLLNTSLGILNLQERQRVALFIRRDDFERFISCLVFIPRDRYDTNLRRRVQKILEVAFAGEVYAYYIHLGETPLARLHVMVSTTPGGIPAYDADEIERQLAETARSWTDALREALVAAGGEKRGLELFERYGDAFRSGYRDRVDPISAVSDIAKLEKTLQTGELEIQLYRPPEAAANRPSFKLYHPRSEIPLSDIVPMLEHMGFRVLNEMPYRVSARAEGVDSVVIHDIGLETGDGSDVDLDAVQANFEDAFRRLWRGEIESDGFNGLILKAGLAWREVVILRAYCKYLRQAGFAFSRSYMELTMAANPGLARLIAELFLTLFDPSPPVDAGKSLTRIRRGLEKGLDAVVSADEDRILRRFINVVESTLRTNYFQMAEGGAPKPYLSFKLDSSLVDDLPPPRPMFEVFVYSPRVEAIHLRGGKVARGGIRWSDRRQDFRTEILGLMKAQQVKNAVIVPVGAKGGFVVKKPPASGDREAQIEEGIACYKTLIRGLLDLTDNLDGPLVVPPRDVVRRDGDDPYLVVAADKGTAAFSDIANGISAEYGFWLGDAFASGGSNGYDHKKMGITARGAWESIKRHFREAGLDIQKQDFTVIGVGDMSGDVFGNGMLLSPHIKLQGAFNHLHIFIDPNPDPATSLAERRRLFRKSRSSWSDYNRKRISRGGGVFERRAKSISLTPRIKRMFGISKDKVTPQELIRAMLRAPVDLLWFGGIGTFVKASDESHIEVGDRATDALRVDASELQCRVVGEGANLGLTQRGRMEYALAGGRLNADSIDNSAGVDCSDHEVNIKILLDSVVAEGGLSEKQRNALLRRMTKEVGELVLSDNYLQTQAMTMVETMGWDALDQQAMLMRSLERVGGLDRAIEFLPNEEVLAERHAARLGLTRPEIAMLMAHSKIWLYGELLKSELPDDPQLVEEELVRYFPRPLRRQFLSAIGVHRLRREIIATHVTNSMINRVGGFFVTQLGEKTGAPPADVAHAYIITRNVFSLRETWRIIESLDNKVAAAVQTEMFLECDRPIEVGTLWFLRNAPHALDIGANIATFADGVETISRCLEEVLPEHYREDLHGRARAYVEQGVPEELALRVAGLLYLVSGCDIVRLAQDYGRPVGDVARLYFAIGTRFHLGRLRAASERLVADNHWQRMAAASLIEDFYVNQRTLAKRALETATPRADAEQAIAAWIETRSGAVEGTHALLAELLAAGNLDYSMLAVASRRLQALTAAPDTP